ncbi:hypothetical protein [Bacteroides propionicifaciens]|uniref:hypothetical protein n=1 Tax=Bacteroides propionicifaciens TaxID=392838 RepID=UPI0003719D7F|nr:hypothetical protein [Bacteroides propionicifaciens]
MNYKIILSLSCSLLLSGTAISATPKLAKTNYVQDHNQQTPEFAVTIKKQALLTMEAINDTFRSLHSANKNASIDNAIENANSLIVLLGKSDSQEGLSKAQKLSFQSVLKRTQRAKTSLGNAKSESSVRKVKQEIVEAKKNLGKALGTIDKAVGYSL